MESGLRLYRFVSYALPEGRHASDAEFLDHWRSCSHVQGDTAEGWRRKMVPILSEATALSRAIAFDSSTPEAFCRCLVKAGVIEVEPGYDALC